jgi:sugar lactone lactonase YvrE
MSILTRHATGRPALLVLTAATFAVLVVTGPANAATSNHDTKGAQTITVNGSNAFPESVATDKHYVYTTSIGDGTVYRGRLGAKTLYPFLPGGQDDRTQATGVKVTGDRLLVAGGFTGRYFIYTTAGTLISSYTVPDPAATTLVNDSAVAPNGDVYITDSFRAVVYRIPAAEVHARPTGAPRTLAVAYDLPDYVSGQSNGNGIVATPDGKFLIIGYYYSGALYQLTLATGDVSTIAAPALPSADGMALRGNTLYIARAENNTIVTAQLSRDRTRVAAVRERTYPGADTVTGVAVSGDRLLTTNSQMDTFLFGAPLTSPVFTLESLPR